MRTGSFVRSLCGFILLLFPGKAAVRAPDVNRTNILYANLALRFEPNRGHANRRVKYLARGAGFGVFLTQSAAVLVMQGRVGEAGCSVSIEALGAKHAPSLDATGLLEGKSNYLTPTDSREWQTDIPNYSQVKYHGIYHGIDLVFHGTNQEVEYDFILAPGADAGAIRLRFQGAEDLRIAPNGDLVIRVHGCDLTQHRPRVFQPTEDSDRQIGGDFVMADDHTVGFRVGTYDHSRPLVIDPVVYSYTASGGGTAIAVDQLGNAFVTGSTTLPGFPTTPGAYQTSFNGGACYLGTRLGVVITGPCPTVFVLKLSADGSTLIYSTYLGAGTAGGIAIDLFGNACITGSAGASFPITPGPLPKGQRGSGLSGTVVGGAYVAKLNSQGTALLYSTVLGDSAEGTGIAADATGSVYVAGVTLDQSFPTTLGAFQTTFRKSTAGFVIKINDAGNAVVYSTLLSGSGMGGDTISALAVDAGGDVYVTGTATSSDFPTTPGAYKPVFNRGGAYATKLNPVGSSLRYSTFLSGSGQDSGAGIVVDGQGEAFVAGTTGTTNFPAMTTFGPPTGVQGGGSFIVKLDAAGASLIFSAVLGGAAATAITIDSQGASYVTGGGTQLPVTSTAEVRCSGVAFLSKLSPDGRTLLYSSYVDALPDTPSGFGTAGVALDPEGNAYVVDSVSVSKVAPQPGPLVTAPCFSATYWDIDGSGQSVIAPGEVVAIKGYNLGPQTGAGAQLDRSGRIAATLAGAQVLVGGTPAPLLYVQASQISFMVPFEVAGKQQVPVQVKRAGQASDSQTASVAEAAPAILHVQPVSVGCFPAVLNQDMTVNSPLNPAQRGSVVAIYAEGGGQLDQPVVDGSLATFPLPKPVLQPVQVWFQNFTNFGEVVYAGSAPGLILGALQINARIPDNVLPGSTMFGLSIGGFADHSLACINVK